MTSMKECIKGHQMHFLFTPCRLIASIDKISSSLLIDQQDITISIANWTDWYLQSMAVKTILKLLADKVNNNSIIRSIHVYNCIDMQHKTKVGRHTYFRYAWIVAALMLVNDCDSSVPTIQRVSRSVVIHHSSHNTLYKAENMYSKQESV